MHVHKLVLFCGVIPVGGAFLDDYPPYLVAVVQRGGFQGGGGGQGLTWQSLSL